MKRTIALLFATVMMAGCASNEGIFIDTGDQNGCGTTGYTFAGVLYGDSYIVGLPYAEIVAGAEFLIFLETLDRDNATVTNLTSRTVTIEGKSDTNEDDWLAGSGTGAGQTISICIPANVANGDYNYLIRVDGVGELDPRARVINRPETR